MLFATVLVHFSKSDNTLFFQQIVSYIETMKTDDLKGWQAFIIVAVQGNFAKASRETRIPVSQLSKRVSALEERLGVRLFQRSTRVVTLTDEGRTILPRIRETLENITEIENSFSENKELSGTVRVTSVPFIANKLLIPIIKDFRQMNPKVKIHLTLSEKKINIIESNIDIAIRIETPKDTDLIYRKLAANDLVFCATPKYLKERGVPDAPEDLQSHDMLFLKIHEGCKFVSSSVQLGQFSGRRSVESDDGVFLTELALQSAGVLVRSIWDVKDHFEKGRLVQVLKKNPLETFGYIHAVVPSKKFLAPRVRAFYEFVLSRAKEW